MSLMDPISFSIQVADQNIKNLEDLQDEYDFKINTLKNRGEEDVSSSSQKRFLVSNLLDQFTVNKHQVFYDSYMNKTI